MSERDESEAESSTRSRKNYRPPCRKEANTYPRASLGDLERRVCPTCRLFYDTGADSERVFCSLACERRHERGVYLD